MNYLLTIHRRLEWQHVFSYLIIVIIELIVLRTLSGTTTAMIIRYVTFFSIVALSVFVARYHIIRPIQAMKRASLRIAAGNYHERLPQYSSIELTDLASTFNEMAEMLETTEKRRIELIGNIAHELRTPLSNIKVTMEGLIDNVLEPDQAIFFSMQREANRLQRLVQQLETLSRAESGQIELELEAVDMAWLVKETCTRLQPQYMDKGVVLQCDCDADLPAAYADRDRIVQVVVNLLGNALQYTRTGGHVMLRLIDEASWIKVEVTDTGIGLPAAELTRIFERFYRVDESRARSTGGNGIGLTITKHLVLAHGGTIWAESAGDDRGTTFIFTLPIAHSS